MKRLGFIPHRIWQSVIVLLGVTILVFFTAHLLPGNPAVALLGNQATPQRVAALTKQMGLNEPLWVQYLHYMGNIFHGNLGESFAYQAPVTSLLISATPVSLELICLSLIFTLIISVPLASWAAAKPDRLQDEMVRAYSMLAQGMPQFWLGIVLLLGLSLKLHIFPVGGMGTGFADDIYHLTLPALTIAIAMSPTVIRSLRTSMIQVLQSDYMVTARSKGLPPSWLLSRHVLKNASIPMVSVLGVNLGYLIGGTLVVEQVFAVSGLGSLMIKSIFARDFPVIQGVTLCIGVFVVVIGLITDILYVLLDPRVSISGKAEE